MAEEEEDEGPGDPGEMEAAGEEGDRELDAEAEASIEANTAAMLSSFQEGGGEDFPGDAAGEGSGGLDGGGTFDGGVGAGGSGDDGGGEDGGAGAGGSGDDNGEAVTDFFVAGVDDNTAAILAEFQEPQGAAPADNGATPEEGWDAASPDEGQVEANTEAMLAQFGDDNQEGADALGEGDEGADEAGGSGGDAVTGDIVKAEDKKFSKDALGGGGDTKGHLIKVKGLDKQQLCIDLLMVGCVQSFVDFFYITQRKSASSDSTPMEADSKDIDFPEETLIFLKESLESAESARRCGNYQMCFESYNTLAEYFEKVPDLKGAMYFYQRCADVATEVDARESISKAFLNLGSCEERGKNWQSAMNFHEKALQIATSADSLPLQIKAASRLTEVYQVLAEECEKEGRDNEASMLYERCRDCAQLSKDANLEGTACHKLGLSKFKTGAHDQAVELQKQYLDICRMHDDRIGESKARGALAQAYEAMGVTQEAIKQLENLLNVANEAGELKAQAHACLNLGILYNGRGEHEKSVELLEQHFHLARQIGDRKLIDSARVVLGMVRGNGKLKSYIELVNNDLEKLLRWKSKRQVLDGA